MFLIGLIVVILIIIAFYYKFYVSLPVYGNNVLDLIKTQKNWNYYNGGVLVSPYSFNITGNGTMQISYFDSLGGYLQGTVVFNATYQIIDSNNVQITPVSLISSATRRWPQGQTWKLTYVSSSNLNLNINTQILSLTTS